ncbi:MAG: substrate-binding domain-containing protein [Spirochaetales bacterium]|nr:substrate-binding domain-containing protein [Spirochaetales bacterium]
MEKPKATENITIGYLTSDLSSTYNCTIWEGIKQVCEQRDVNFLYFSGGRLKAPYESQYPRNKVYELVTEKIIDGLIINSATIFHFVSKSEIKDFYKRFLDIPIVNIAMKVRDIPTVLVDNTKGMRDGLVHLIQDHGYKKIAFIKGAGANIESSIRYNTYKKVLQENGIQEDSNLVETGNFFYDEAQLCVERLFKRNKHIDAIVAANDDMALGALKKAQELGMIVPNELAIMGFDDIEDAKNSSIPLTTVRQPLSEQAKKAAYILIDMIKENKIPKDVSLPTELVIRKSCGCFSESVLNARITIDRQRKNLTAGGMRKNYSQIVNQCDKKKSAIRPFDMNLYKKLLDSFIEFTETDNWPGALSTLDMLLNQETVKENIDIDKWENILSALIKSTLPYIQEDRIILTKAESFWQQVRILIQETSSHSQAYFKMKSELQSANLRKISSELIRNFDLTQLVQTMAQELPHFGIESCYLSLYDKRDEESEYSKLILGYNGKHHEKVPGKGIRFKTKDLLPGTLTSLDRLSNFIIEPLFFQDEQFGFILLKTNPKTVLFEALRQQICSALKGALLVQDIVDKETLLEKLLKDQEKRAKELENAYQALQENQKKMIIIEKMASLGRMTAGIAHEINTPLAAIRATLVELESLVEEYRQSIGDKEVTVDDHREIAGDMSKSIQISQKAAEKIVHFVQSIKSQTRDLSPQEQHIFNAVPVIQDAILLLNHELRKNKCSVNFKSSTENIEIHGSGGRLSQIITNLLTNAIDAYKSKHGGPITIKLFYNSKTIDLTVKDKGTGIKKENLSKIFDPLFSTKRLSEGTGLGLTIVHNIITGDFGGAIEVDSEIDEGTIFTLHFPKPARGAKHGQKI